MNSFKQRCIELRKKDYTLNEIVKATGRSKSSVYAHIYNIPLSQKKQVQISKNSQQLALRVAASRKGKALKPFKPFVAWSPDRVRLIAHLIFDGELRWCTCGYSNRSCSSVKKVEKLFLKVYQFEPRRHFNQKTGVYRIYYHNVELGKFIRDKADELLDTMTSLARESQKEFLQAFFDDEGCMDYRPTQNKRRIRGYQKDKKVLFLVQKLLRNFDIESIIREPNEVVISGKENLEKFQKEINFSKGVRLNPKRTNSIWKKNIEKRKLLDMAIKSFKT